MDGALLSLLATLSCAYALRYLYRSYRFRTLASPDSLYAALVLQHFFIPGLLVGVGLAPALVNTANQDFVLTAAFFALIGLLAVQVGVKYGVQAKTIRFRRRNQGRRVPVRWKSSRLLLVVVLLLLIGWATRLYIISSGAYFQIERTSGGQLEGNFYAAIRMIELFPLNVISILAIRHWRDDHGSSEAWGRALWLAVAAEVLYWLPSGRKEPVILAVALPLLIRYLRTGWLPSFRAVAVLLGLVVALFPIAFAYRYALEVGGTSIATQDPLSVIGLIMSGSSEYGKSATEIVFGRMSLLEPLAACIRALESGIWKPMIGESYALALLGLIPRFIWTEKPDLHYGNEFGYVAGLVSTRDTATSISVTFFGESYLNFGLGGVAPLAAIGLIFGLIYRQALTSSRRETALLVYSVALPTVLYVGGTFALYFGGLIKALPFFYAIGRFMETRSTQYRHPFTSNGKL